ncbi:Androgen-induced gene 1 protein [Varanus komodoensis]|nr:Androgen-induced gene 1 protein [Varanus komodoensis]
MALALRGQRAVALLHFLCFLWAVFALSQNLGVPRSVRKEQDKTYAGQWKYLTFLNQVVTVLQTILYALCSLIDVVALCIPSKEKRVSYVVVPIRDFIFSAFVFPVGLFVAVAFWGLYAYDRELIYPAELDAINPSWLNHSMGQGPQLGSAPRPGAFTRSSGDNSGEERFPPASADSSAASLPGVRLPCNSDSCAGDFPS